MSNDDKDSVNKDESIESTESEEGESGESEQIEDVEPLIISTQTQAYIETELGMVKFIDYLIEESFNLAFRNIDTYTKRFFDQFMNVEREDSDELLISFNKLKIEEAVDNIKRKSEEVAIDNGIKRNIQKRMNRANYVIMGIVFGGLIITMLLAPDLSNIFLIPAMVVVCVVPTFLKKWMENKWNIFKSEHLEELLNLVQEDVGNLRIFNQLALDDCRDYMLNQNFPLQLLKFELLSNDYNGLKLLEEKISNKQKVYYFEFEYPEGIEPFPVPKQVLSEGKVAIKQKDPLINDDDENDIFILLPDVEFTPDNIATFPDQKLAGDDEQTVIVDLLDTAEKFEVVKNPEKIMNNFNDNEQLLCDCKSPLKLKELRNVATQKFNGFEFYLGISAKCEKCGKNPFIILKKDNSDIPNELENLF